MPEPINARPVLLQRDPSPLSSVTLLLRHARTLHRAATSGPLVSAMPALRRVHAAAIFPGQSLSALHRNRQGLRRKHFLRALALESGYPDWETFRPVLATWPVAALANWGIDGCAAGILKHWFASVPEAAAFALLHGGHVQRVGTQAVLCPVADHVA